MAHGQVPTTVYVMHCICDATGVEWTWTWHTRRTVNAIAFICKSAHKYSNFKLFSIGNIWECAYTTDDIQFDSNTVEWTEDDTFSTRMALKLMLAKMLNPSMCLHFACRFVNRHAQMFPANVLCFSLLLLQSSFGWRGDRWWETSRTNRQSIGDFAIWVHSISSSLILQTKHVVFAPLSHFCFPCAVGVGQFRISIHYVFDWRWNSFGGFLFVASLSHCQSHL